jgi:organic hydroperoxide reductase OsmC/OhrA
VLAKSERGAMWVSAVTLSPQIVWTGSKLPTADDLDRLHHRAHEDCFIANSVKTTITVESAGA